MEEAKLRVYRLLLLSIGSIIFVLLFSYSTSPLYHMYGNADSAIFQTVGYFWSRGNLPYRELWDHKGPLIFAINAAGYWICGKFGITILQIICLNITGYYVYKIAKIRYSNVAAMFIVFFCFIKLGLDYEEGNYTEEYMLPFISASLYGMSRWAEENQSSHPVYWAFVYGAGFGACILTRITNAVPILSGTFFISCILVKHHKISNLVHNAVSFLGGVCVMMAPFMCYFFCKNALSDMWYGMIGYNMTYIENTGLGLSSKTMMEVIRVFFAYFGSLILCLISLISIVSRKSGKEKTNRSDCLAFLISLSMLFLFFSGNGYLHYGIIEMPLVPLFALRIYEFGKISNMERKRVWRRVMAKIFAWGGVSLCFLSGLWGIKRVWSACHKHDNKEYHISLLDYIPIEEKESFIAWHCPNWIYLKEDIMPYYKYFILQSWHAFNSGELREKIHDTFETGDVRWILINDAWSEYYPTIVQDVVDEKYYLVDNERYSETEDYYLYRLRQR